MDEIYVNSKDLAHAFGEVGTRWIQQLVQDGILQTQEVKDGRGRSAKRYGLIDSTNRYVKHLKNKIKNGKKPEKDVENSSSKLDAEARLKTAKAKIEELKLAAMTGSMYYAEDVEAVMADHVINIRALLLAIPARLAVDLAAVKTAPEASEILKKEIYSILSTMSAYEYDPEAFRERRKEMLTDDDEEE